MPGYKLSLDPKDFPTGKLQRKQSLAHCAVDSSYTKSVLEVKQDFVDWVLKLGAPMRQLCILQVVLCKWQLHPATQASLW